MGSAVRRIAAKIPLLREDDEEPDLKIISRAEWKARVPKWREDLDYPALSATTTYTDTEPCTTTEECTRAVQEIQMKQMDEEGLPDIAYSFLIGGDGRVYEGRGWHTISNKSTLIKCVDPEFPAPKPMISKELLMQSPDRRLVIAYIGDKEKNKATRLMEDTVRALVDYALDTFRLYSGEKNEFKTAEDFIQGLGKKKKTEDTKKAEESSDEEFTHY
ncbi:peptidoglycan-recognition protein SD-like [Macrosteles quadrilineatus]|uniref:peptidoglycan-recognition protein SD-like n=1 Tax=Macrosteles quadrilineatus TaxID=74068 RepID=UPI0023E14F89|nr:peptidoglycan-recognition protein SD-like [Macrosteles quadrilineatus]